MEMEIKKLVRKSVLNFTPYVAGRPPEEIKRRFKIETIDKLASNENPLGPSRRALTALEDNLKWIYLYPDSDGFYLKRALAKRLGVKRDNIILGSGTDELIEIIAKTFLNREDEIIVSRHAFIRYKMAGDLMGCRVIVVPMKNFTHDLRAMKRHITKRTKIIFIANPNNPTGTYVNQGEVMEFFRNLPERIITVIDEAYYEYVERSDYPETIPLVKRGKSVIVLRTFSKIWALAGLRIGYGISRNDIISFMERIRPPFNVTSLSQAAAVASLGDRRQVKRSQQMVKKERKYLEGSFRKLNLEYIPSVANLILLKVGNGKRLFNKLLREGIIVRAMDEYDLPEYIRVSVGLPNQNRRFIGKLRKILGNRRNSYK